MHSASVRTRIVSATKPLVEAALAVALRAVGQDWRKGRRAILSYHNIVPDNRSHRGDISLHLTQSAFRAHLASLAAACDVVPLDELLTTLTPTGKPLVSITFDDGYVGAVRLGLAELKTFGFPSTMFCAPGLLNGQTFWWDRWLDPKSGAPASFRSIALTDLNGHGPRVNAHAESLGLTPWEGDEWSRSVEEGELKAVAAAGECTIGSHTLLHRNLASKIASEDLLDDLAQAREWVETFGDRATHALCLPYGLVSHENLSTIRRAGYEKILRVNGGPLPDAVDSLPLLPRVCVPSGLSAHGLRIRLAGFLNT